MTDRQRIKRLDNEVAVMRVDLAALESAGLSNDLKAMRLRDGIRATTYLADLSRTDLAEPKYDLRFTSVGKPLRKKWRGGLVA